MNELTRYFIKEYKQEQECKKLHKKNCIEFNNYFKYSGQTEPTKVLISHWKYNHNHKCLKHKDKRNQGESYIIGFGNYEGGEFEILSDPYHDDKTDTMTTQIRTPDIKDPGSIVVFPGFLHHRVAPVTKGVRHSVVLWCLGPPFV